MRMARVSTAAALAMTMVISYFASGTAIGARPHLRASARPPAATVTITYWTNNTNPVEHQIVSAFERANPTIKVNLTAYDTNRFLQAMKIASTNRTLPDVFFEGLGATLAHQYESAGLILNLDSYASKYHWNSQFLPLAIKLLNYKGHSWEEPLYLPAMGMFYRKDIFARYHLGVPKTFARFLNILNVLKAHGVTPISMGGQGSWLTMRFTDALIEHYAGPTLNDKIQGGKASWNSKPVIQALTTLKSWTDKAYFTPGFLSIDPTTDYIPLFQGRAAMILEGPWEDSIIVANHQPIARYGFFPFPEDHTPNRLSTFAQGIMVAANSGHKDAAIKFMMFYDSAQTLKKFAPQLQGPIARLGVPAPKNQPHVGQIKQILVRGGAKAGFLPTDQLLPQQLVESFFHAQDSVVAGSLSPAGAAQQIQNQIEAYKHTHGG